MTRRYGQHFLTDASIVRRIVEVSGVSKSDAVLEIGPGRGILTRALAGAAAKVLAVEIDRHLAEELRTAGVPANVEVRRGDVLEMPAAEITEALGNDYSLVSNLPYEITSSVLQKFLPMRSASRSGPTRLTLMLQEEVGERIAAAPGRMNRLALFCGYYAEAKLAFRVPPGAFSPPPKVRSCVIRIDVHARTPLAPRQEQAFFRLIEAAFRESRKQLKNSLTPLLGPGAEDKLISAGMRPQDRPENTSLSQWISLARAL